MNKFLAGTIFGVAVGAVTGATGVVVIVARSNEMRDALGDMIARKVADAVYGRMAPTGRVPYNSYRPSKAYYDRRRKARTRSYYDRMSVAKPGQVEFRVHVDSLEEGQEAINTLEKMIQEYGVASVYDFKNLLDLSPVHVSDSSKGWTDLRHATVRRLVTGGYELVMPRTTNI